jgi:methyl-accepting chemotaxis protein
VTWFASLRVRTVGIVFGVMMATVLTLSGLQMLAALDSTDRSLGRMEGSLAQINGGVRAMNDSQNGLTRIDASMGTLAASTDRIATSVARSKTQIAALAAGTRRIDRLIGAVDESTRTITTRLGAVDTGTATLASSVTALGGTVTPLVDSTASVRRSVDAMGAGIDGMNGSLRYVIRVLNYLSAPKGGGGFAVRISLDPRMIPDIGGVELNVDPVGVFARNRWKTYAGP